jgi:hypothetical protein
MGDLFLKFLSCFLPVAEFFSFQGWKSAFQALVEYKKMFPKS